MQEKQLVLGDVDYLHGWWETIFNKVYLKTDARSINDEKKTLKEIEMIRQAVDPQEGQAILDLCGGQGRHAIELIRHGFGPIWVVDGAKDLIDLGKKKYHELQSWNAYQLPMVFFHLIDAANTELDSNLFQIVMILCNSWGYSPRDDFNRAILEEAYRVCAPGGKFLLDITDPEYMVNNFVDFSAHTEDGWSIQRERKLLKNNAGIVSTEFITDSNGEKLPPQSYFARLYTDKELLVMLAGIGFKEIEFLGNFTSKKNGEDVGFLNNRRIIRMRK
jgi:D-alanine-D-alanine ligase